MERLCATGYRKAFRGIAVSDGGKFEAGIALHDLGLKS
jgi:hypothetical protein